MKTTVSINPAMNGREWLLLFALALLWGCTFFFVAIALRELPPLTLVLLRVGFAALILHAVIAMMGLRLPSDRAAWTIFFGLSLLNNITPFALINWGQSHIASGVASVLNGTTPFFTVIAAHYFTDNEKMTGGRLFGVLAGIAGIAVMVGGAALSSLGVDVAGQLAIVGAAISYTAAGLFGRRLGHRGIAPLAGATGMLTMSTVIMLPVVLIVDQPWTMNWPGVSTMLAVAGMALPSTALAYLIYFRLLATAGPTNLMLVTFLIPVTAILLGVGILGEHLAPRHFAGMALIALGLAAIDGRIWRMIRGPGRPPEK
jgi:drug/metabolite transporter (DMT)-like permease